MSNTIRDNTCYYFGGMRSKIRYISAVKSNQRWLEELEENYGFKGRPRDKQLSNIRGEKIVTDWDDLFVSSIGEMNFNYFNNNPEIYLECNPEDKFATYILGHYIAAPKLPEMGDILKLKNGKKIIINMGLDITLYAERKVSKRNQLDNLPFYLDKEVYIIDSWRKNYDMYSYLMSIENSEIIYIDKEDLEIFIDCFQFISKKEIKSCLNLSDEWDFFFKISF